MTAASTLKNFQQHSTWKIYNLQIAEDNSNVGIFLEVKASSEGEENRLKEIDIFKNRNLEGAFKFFFTSIRSN